MSATLRNLRRTHSYLTPGFYPDDEIPLLRRSPLHDIDRIAALGEANPLPTSEADTPLLARPIEIPQLRRRPQVIHDAGRPTPIVFGTDDPEQQVLARRRALESYQPQKESKKSLALRTILSFVGGGLAGPGGAAETLLGAGGVLDRRGKDRAWQQGELARTDESLGRMRTDRRAGLQDRLLQSQVTENEAQAQRALRAPTVPPIKPTNIFDNAQDVEDAQGNVIMVGPDGKPIIDPATGAPYVRRRLRAPAVKPEKPDTSEFTNQQIDRTIGEIDAEQKTLGPSPPTEIEDRDTYGVVVGKKVNPAYLDWARRYRELDDQKRQLQMKRKPTATAAVPITRTSDITEQRIRDAAKAKGLDADQAVKRARARGMIR